MASMQLSIPHRFRSGAELIALLTPSQREAIQVSLSEDDAPRSADIKRETNSLESLSATDLEKIVVTLRSLYTARIKGRHSVEKFVRDVMKDMRRRKPNMFSSPDGWVAATRNFETLLRIESLEMAHRERHLLGADDKRFCGAEVLVDLRPVFTGDAGDELRKLMVSYRLRLGFHTKNDTHEDLYISLDLDDIQALRESLNQAELQGDVLQKQAKKMLRLGGA